MEEPKNKPTAPKKRTHNRESNRSAKLSPKSKEKLSDTEAKYMEARLEGATMKEAAQAAGLSPFYQVGYKIEKRVEEKCPEVFKRVGVTIERIAKKVSDKLDATTTKHFSHHGIVLDERTYEDHTTQLHAAELGLKALGVKLGDDGDSTDREHPAFIINLSFLGPERAAQVLAAQPGDGSDR